MKKVAVLGCGPAGLTAAHVAIELGHDVTIISRKEKSRLYGAQYLHHPVLPERESIRSAIVQYELNGHPDAYRLKVYPEGYSGPVSPELLPKFHPAWDIRKTYDILWLTYNSLIDNTTITPDWPSSPEIAAYDEIISTIPRRVWAKTDQEREQFQTERIWAIGDAPDLDQRAPFRPHSDNVVLLDGTPDVSWYRLSQVFGHATIEWPGHLRRPPINGVVSVRKPLSTTHRGPDFTFMGRYGKWQKGELTSDVFEQTKELLQ